MKLSSVQPRAAALAGAPTPNSGATTTMIGIVNMTMRKPASPTASAIITDCRWKGLMRCMAISPSVTMRARSREMLLK